MKQSHADQTGDYGQSDVATFFMKLGWGPLPTGKQDLGTDLFVQIRSEDRTDLGMMLGVQVKTGDSFFKRKVTIDGRNGWWFREPNQKHRGYWSDHDVAHILIAQDQALSRRYWARLDRTTIESTGKGIRVFVAEDQPVGPEAAPQWAELVREAQRRASFQGENWNFKISQVAESEWARYALLAPRIVAPHPNRGVNDDINWAEAVALCIRSEAHRWNEFAERRSAVPSVSEAGRSADPGWRFAAAVHGWTFGETEALEALSTADLPLPLQIPHAVLTSMLLEGRGESAEAATILGSYQAAGLASVDQAWLALHRGWQLYEAGEFELAEGQVRASVAMHGAFSGGLINSAIRSAGVLSLFQMAPLLTGDVAAAVQAADTTTSWWQTQQVEEALNSYLRNSFDQWLREEGVIKLGQSDPTHNDLLSAERVAWLVGNRRSSRYAAFLRALANLTLPQGRHALPEQQLTSLRRGGYRNEMKKVLRKFRRDGPLAPISAFMEDVTPEASTTTSMHADLEALDSAGSYLAADVAAVWLRFLIGSLNDPEVFAKRFRFQSDPRPDLLDAVAGLYVHFDADSESALIDFVITLTKSTNQLFERPVRRVLKSISKSTLVKRSDELLAQAMQLDESSWMGKLMLEAATRHSADARAEVTRRILSGGLSTTLAGLAIDDLTLEEATVVLEGTRARLTGLRGQKNGMALGGSDPHLTTAMLALFGPESIRADAWATLLEALAQGDPIPERKTAAIEYLADASESIPTERVEGLIRVAEALREGQPSAYARISFSGTQPVQPACDRLLIALRVPGDDFVPVVADLVARPSDYREFMIRKLARQQGFELLLLALSRDANPKVSVAALCGLARRAAEDPAIARWAVAPLVQAMQSGGEDIALRIGGGVLDADNRCPESASVIEALRHHESAVIRHLASDLEA